MYESIYKNDELENEVSSDMSFFWYSDIPLSRCMLGHLSLAADHKPMNLGCECGTSCCQF